VLTRVAASHLRVGTFQFFATRGTPEQLKALADYTIARHDPALAESEQPYRDLLRAACERQAALIARWMGVGFIHGVMNTDNMTISGETIDYGPCAFLDAFDPATVYSSIDTGGRYAYGNQPGAAEWNLARLAEALLPLLHDDQEQAVALAVESLGDFRDRYAALWSAGMAAKLGLPEGLAGDVSGALVDDLLALLRDNRVDHTGFYRALGAAARGDAEPARGRFLDLAGFDAWSERWLALEPDAAAMDRVNPVYVPRNHLVEEALAAGSDGDPGPLQDLLRAGPAPYEQRPGLERYAEPAPDSFGTYRTFCGT